MKWWNLTFHCVASAPTKFQRVGAAADTEADAIAVVARSPSSRNIDFSRPPFDVEVLEKFAPVQPVPGAPIPMLLWCPGCHARHIDVGEFETRPHSTHACQTCGLAWRPAIVATVGVQFLPGFKD
jgi:hypothetical protein